MKEAIWDMVEAPSLNKKEGGGSSSIYHMHGTRCYTTFRTVSHVTSRAYCMTSHDSIIDLMKSDGLAENVVKFNICLVQDFILSSFEVPLSALKSYRNNYSHQAKTFKISVGRYL